LIEFKITGDKQGKGEMRRDESERVGERTVVVRGYLKELVESGMRGN